MDYIIKIYKNNSLMEFTKRFYKTDEGRWYYQILPNGELFKTYNKRSEIPEEFNKENVGSACNKGSKYKGYYWKNKL